MQQTQERKELTRQAEVVQTLARKLIKGRPPTMPTEELCSIRDHLGQDPDPESVCCRSSISKILEGRHPRAGHLRKLASRMDRIIKA